MTECPDCKTELTENYNNTGCQRCLKCKPATTYTAPEEKETRYVDIKMSEEIVIEIIDRVVPDMVRGILENWHIQKPPVTKDEIPPLLALDSDTGEVSIVKEETWREQAKRLGIRSSQRKKADVINDIEAKLNDPEGVNN